VEREARWEDREARHAVMDRKRAARVTGEQAQLMPGLPIVIPDKAGVSRRWARCVEEGLVEMQGLHQEARDRPSPLGRVAASIPNEHLLPR